MLARRHRFHGHHSVNRVRGRMLRCGVCRVHVVHNLKRQEYKMAVVVSKKTAKSAIVRNRIRRRLFEYVRQYGDLQHLPLDIVCIVSDATVADMPTQQFTHEMGSVCRRIRHEFGGNS